MRRATNSSDQTEYVVIGELEGTEALAARFTTHKFRPHYHETFLIGVTEDGAERFEARGARHLAPAGSLRFFNPGEVHTGEVPEGGVWGYRCLYPTADLLNALAREAGRREPVWFPDMIVQHEELAAELSAALRMVGGRTTALERSTRLRWVLSRIVVLHAGAAKPAAGPSPVRPEPRALKAAEVFIADRIAEDFALPELARAAGMSPYHLVRVFKARRGLTPFAFQTQLRIARARTLLAQGASAEAAALACGFYDRGHLARVFRATVGVTPTAYREAVTGRRRPESGR